MAATTPAPVIDYPINTPTLTNGRTIEVILGEYTGTGSIAEIRIQVNDNFTQGAGVIAYDSQLRALDGRLFTADLTHEVNLDQMPAIDEIATWRFWAQWRNDAGDTVSLWSPSAIFAVQFSGTRADQLRQAF